VKRARTRTAPKTVAEYIAQLPPPARPAFRRLRAAVRSAAPPGATETISYRIPALRHHGRVLVWFAAFSDHCSLFPTAAVVAAFKKDLKGFPYSKGTVHFPLDRPLPVAVIRRMVKARVAQSVGRKRR